ncbi:hypothetical protein [Terribacillus sp. DMT04]|uniref:hypothetical protein n=1 Tax=Terribacillus sp. DMT04 TaxID=2850441 RepID=UPI001C2C91BD|nr:hypothetical protein [Terribacillus sp. DMT04]QXE02343.1 hypothetical protein KS242_03700 [Terribacillus sp. DMT04]
MNTFLKVILGIIIGAVVIIAFLAVSFITEMSPDSEKEEAIKNKASGYLNENFSEDFEIVDTLYDNMGNFEFEYAAKARSTNNGIEFFIYEDDDTRKLIDTYVSDKWREELESDIRVYLEENFTDVHDYFALFDNEIGKKLSIKSSEPGSYKEHEVSPLIRIDVAREKEEQDDEHFNAFVSYLKEEGILEHGTVIFSYVAESGAILEQEDWRKEF